MTYFQIRSGKKEENLKLALLHPVRLKKKLRKKGMSQKLKTIECCNDNAVNNTYIKMDSVKMTSSITLKLPWEILLQCSSPIN